MAINYNVNPYYDDYNETKQFYRILFRPGRAVQARELTQIQTSLQKQIERFGQSIYKEGSIVVPGGLALDRDLYYANLTSSFGSNVSDTLISSLVNETITGSTSGVKALVVNYQTSTSTEPATIYLKYVSSNIYANGVNTVFQAGETFKNISGNITLQIANTNATGVGTQFSVTSGVVLVKGHFAYFDTQKFIVEKYSQANNTILGFNVTESTVEATSDTSLLDPAVGASNYVAPGADRYKIALDLAKRPLTASATDDPNFVEMVRLEDGEIISKNITPQYSVLGATLARRTYDESGDYVVKPYGLSIINHLRSSNTINDGYFLASDGGDANKLVNIISPGKSYVKGYEIENIRSKYLTGNKAREYANVNNGVVSTPIGNYIEVTNIHSLPDLSILPTVTFYDQYNSSKGSANGTIIGTGKIRGVEFSSGTPGSTTAIYKVWLFDVEMQPGYVFERDVKQLYVNNSGYEDFTADISPTLTILTGSVTLSNTTGNGSNVIVGTATKFDTELTVGDYITVDNQTFRVGGITNATVLTANTLATTNVAGVFARLNTVVYNQTKDLSHIFPLPYSTIRSVDPTNLETSYDVRRAYSRTLSSNTVTISAGTDESFDGISTTNYILTIKSGAFAGNTLNPSNYITRASGGSSITINLTSLADTPANVTAYSTADIAVVARLTKTNTAADKKTKTLVANTTIDYTDANTAQASTISLGKADVYQLVSVYMSNAAFGSAYSATGAIDITDRYTLDNGQRLTFYDVGSISLKPNAQKPTGPIRITFDYFTHGTGDYFSVGSYSINYDDIPTFTSGGITYKLRDCLDFRPRINDAGTGFSGTGAVVNDFLEPTGDVITDYSYYLPRIDKIVIDKDGQIKYVQGVSSLSPKEPKTPADSMALFVLNQKAYVFNINEDIEVTTVDNRRYTMRDIGRIENRVKNLEYYTTLNLLERETESLQIQDSDGFDRFKNGFIVDNFSGHGIGDVFNRDYGVSIDYNNQELRPFCETTNLALLELNTSDAQRTANNYVSANGVITLPYTHTEYIKNEKGTTTENINPFSIITWLGKVTLDPPGDVWFEQQELPSISRNENGNYDQFLADAQAKGTYGTVWGNWESVYYGSTRVDTRRGTVYEVVEQIDTRTDNDVVVSREVLPKMRDVVITFTGEGLKPNTQVYIFFDNINVTEYCSQQTEGETLDANTAINRYVAGSGRLEPITTDSIGKVVGYFNYASGILNLDTGEKPFRITDSPVNDSNFETLAEATFNSSGELQYIRDEIVSVRNAVLNTKDLLDSQSFNTGPNGPDGPDGPSYTGPTGPNPPSAPSFNIVDAIWGYGFGVDSIPKSKYNDTVKKLDKTAREEGYSNFNDMLSQASVTPAAANAFTPDGGIDPLKINGAASVGANDAAVGVFQAINKVTTTMGTSNPYYKNQPDGLIQANRGTYDIPGQQARTQTAAQIALGVVAAGSGVATTQPWVSNATGAATNGVTASRVSSRYAVADCIWDGPADPLAQSFFVDRSLYLTKIDLFFSGKDNTIPMRVQIRKMNGGVPGPFIVPFSEKLVYPSEITTSADGSVATSIEFEAPIYLDAGEYAIVLLADSINYRVWISEINQNDILTDSLVSEQPYIGVLFKSQNASTWTPDQYQDLKFTLYRANFDTSVTSTIDFIVNDESSTELEEDPFEVYPNSNIMRVYHQKHGQNTGSYVRIAGWPLNDSFGVDYANSNFYGITLDELYDVPFAIDNTTINSYTITLPNVVNSNVSTVTRTGGLGVTATNDFRYDAYYPAISSVVPSGTTITHKIKGTAAITYTPETIFTTISVGTNEFDSSKVLAANVNKQLLMSNTQSFVHRVEMTTNSSFLTPIIDIKRAAGVFARNIINNPNYNTENKVAANDIVTIANANNIVVTQISGAEGLITLTNAQDKINATSIIKGTYVNISANNGVNNGQYRVLDVTDNGANISIYNVSTQNVSTNATATYTITNGRNFVAEEAAFDGSVYSKYITRQVDFINSCTSFKFYLDVMKPTNGNLKFYYKISEVGDTTELALKEYTEITDVTVPTSLDGAFNEVEKIVENLPAFDAIVFKIVFLADDTSQAPKCKNLRIIALA